MVMNMEGKAIAMEGDFVFMTILASTQLYCSWLDLTVDLLDRNKA